jgi:hypothetical protein
MTNTLHFLKKRLPRLAIFALALLWQQVALAQQPALTSSTGRPKKDSNFSGYFEMNYYRNYLWRGAEFGNQNVAQPELLLKYKNWGLLLTQNLNYNTRNLPSYYKKKAVFDEQDVEINYEGEKGKLEYKAAAMFYFYFFQANSPNTGEFYWKLKYPIAGSLKAFTETAHDIVYYPGAIFNNTGLVWEKTIKEKLAVECTLQAGFANKKYNGVYNSVDKAQLNILSGKTELEYSFKKYYMGLMGEWNQYTSPAVKLSTGLSKTNNYYFAFGVNF